MRHEYDDEQINDAIRTAANYGSCGELHSNYLRRFLDALPEPDQRDDWQQGTIDQIRKGDRVRWQDPGMDDTCVYEIIADHTEAEDPGWILFSKTESYYFPPGAVVDRIPKKIVHPDPAEHPVIIDEMGEPWFWAGLDDDYHSPTRPSTFRSPSDFTVWTPAKVVEDDR